MALNMSGMTYKLIGCLMLSLAIKHIKLCRISTFRYGVETLNEGPYMATDLQGGYR
jgi:hypothetical protein